MFRRVVGSKYALLLWWLEIDLETETHNLQSVRPNNQIRETIPVEKKLFTMSIRGKFFKKAGYNRGPTDNWQIECISFINFVKRIFIKQLIEYACNL